MSLEWLGYTEPLPAVSRPLVVVAGGRCVWDDLTKINTNNFDFLCVNDVGMHLPFHVKHWYSNDHFMLVRWCAARRPQYVKKIDERVPKLHTFVQGVAGIQSWPWPGHGTSSLNAVYTGLALGYGEIVLAGIPLDNSGHYFDPPWVLSNFVNEVPVRDGQIRYWQTAKDHVFDGKVKALSGRTKELLG